MTLDEMIKELEELKKVVGGNTPVGFDDENGNWHDITTVTSWDEDNNHPVVEILGE